MQVNGHFHILPVLASRNEALLHVSLDDGCEQNVALYGHHEEKKNIAPIRNQTPLVKPITIRCTLDYPGS